MKRDKKAGKKKFTINKKSISIIPKSIDKTIKAPASKSVMQRAIALALLATGRTNIQNPSFSQDSLSAIRVAGGMGASIMFSADKLSIERTDEVTQTNINFGESGLGVRMFSPIISLFDKHYIINGTGTLLKRPIKNLENILNKIGISAISKKGFLPLEISGKLKGAKFTIDGSKGSQVLTGLLIALPLAINDSEITVKNLKSKPYIDLTIKMINDFGGKIENYNYERFIIKGNQKYIGQDYFIEGDWSGASFLLVAGLIAGKVEVTGLNLNSKQADIEILSAIKKANGKIFIRDNSVITKKSKLTSFEFDATDCPDLFPPLVAMASFCKGISKIKGVSRLKHKESDRSTVLKKEFSKIGINISIEDDFMFIEGGKIQGGAVDSNNDHRIAMATGIVALGAESEITILNADSVNKSYTRFYRDLK